MDGFEPTTFRFESDKWEVKNVVPTEGQKQTSGAENWGDRKIEKDSIKKCQVSFFSLYFA